MKTDNLSLTQTGIWIDGTKAIVIALDNGKESIREIPSEIESRTNHPNHQGKKGTFMGTHHINDERKFEERKKHQIVNFLDRVIKEVQSCDELFVMGPSEMKIHLRTRIENDKNFRPKLKGVAAADHITLNECVAKVKHFYDN